MASQVPQPPLFSRSRASTNPPRRAFEGPRPLTEDKLPFEGSSESDQTPRSAQKQPLHSATSHRKIPVTRAPDEPSPFSPRVIVPTITVSSPNQPIPPLPESLGEVRFSGVHQSRQTVRTFSNADGSLRRHLSFRRKPARGSNNPPSSSAAPAPGDVDNGELGDVDTNDEDSGPIPGLTMRKEQVRRRMANYYASASASGSGSGSGSVRPLPRALEEDFEPFGYWDGEDFYEWPDRDWLGRPRGSRPVSPVSSGKDNDKGKAASGSVLSKVWRKLTVKDRKRKGKGKEKEKEKTRVPKWRSRKEYHMELQSYREWQAQVAGGGVIFDGHEAERDRRSTMGIWTASSSNDGDNEGDESLGPSTATNSFPSQPGDKKKKQGESFIDFVTRLLQKK
ncbi:hypothetical protein CONLIGDRAFT_676083 [Coniochaeta ligniaria NRRL 30616]|uniref:Uncharacterized protein n=1 Tax=Coniochaeta ligniaria NRRL 30616 TaxID=1408157 RepID=A0A1J7J5T4_9PEZI|nr:hypothetical protein CONLIGDRAFT_676083 [Coniochaeta ligniaria NRRL 30616]